MNFTNLENFIDWLTTWKVPGNDCIVVKDGKTVFRHMAGYAEKETNKKMKGDETYYMWSCSKPITAAAALTLYEKGKFALTDNLEDYMPEFADMKVKSCDENGNEILVPAKKKIKVKDIFSMSAGFDYALDTEAVHKVQRETDGRAPTLEVVKAFSTHALNFEPGEHWLYSICHDILAGFVEKVSGMKFSEYVKTAIFEPLGMTDSTFSAVPEKRLVDRMARQYEYNDDKHTAVPTTNKNGFVIGTEYESGGAGLVSTTEDYIKFAYAMANGGVGMNGARILSGNTIDLMRTNHLSETARKDMTWANLVGYGYGLGVRTMVDKAQGGSNGSIGEFGWGGAAGAYVIIDPDNNMALFYVMHMLNNQEAFIAPRLRNLLYSGLDG